MSLSVRSEAAELLDADCPDPQQYALCLRQLAEVNTLTFARGPTLAWLTRAVRRRRPDEAVSVYDVAYGAGDMLRSVARWARRHGRTVKLGGVDMNPRAAEVARQMVGDVALALQTGDVLLTVPDPRPDYIISSLFTHHLTDGELVAFLRWMDRYARHGWFVNDVHRHSVALALFRILARLMRWHPIVRYDGAVSIARGFRRADWLRLLEQADVCGEVRWRFPFRLCVSRLR